MPSHNRKDVGTRLLWSRLWYDIHGPTTLHLQHELGLLMTLTFLTTASLVGLYRTTFGTSGDCAYILLSSLWLSRHLVFRFLVTTDTYCAGYPILSWTRLRHWLTRFFLLLTPPGQYFDPYPLHNSSAYIHGANAALDMTGTSTSHTTNHQPKGRFSPKRLFLRHLLLTPISFTLAILRWIHRSLLHKGKGGGGGGLVDLLSSFTSSNHSRNTLESHSENTSLAHGTTKRHERRTSMDHSKVIKQQNHPTHSDTDFFSSLDTSQTYSTAMFPRIYQQSIHDVALVLDRVMDRAPSIFICILIGIILWIGYFFIYILPVADNYLSGARHFYWSFTSPWDGNWKEFNKRLFSPRKTSNYSQSSTHVGFIIVISMLCSISGKHSRVYSRGHDRKQLSVKLLTT
jgi:hypothetical protein